MPSTVKKLVLASVIGFILVVTLGGYALFKYVKKTPKVEVKPIEEQNITLIEGWTLHDYAEKIEKEKISNKKDFYSALTKVDRSKYSFLVSVPKESDLEGFLFPDTYRIIKGDEVTSLISKTLENFDRKTKKLRVNDDERFIISGYESLSIAGKKGLSLYEVVTLASILEKETGTDLSKRGSDQTQRLIDERKIVAGIFLNRLLIGQALESDATINYITGKDLASPTAKDLERNSAYNTYKFPGLPPGPICNPSVMSIEAVINPTKTNYYYFLHKQPSGEVVYSKTFEEHVNNKFKYLK